MINCPKSDVSLISTSKVELGVRSIASYLRNKEISTKEIFMETPKERYSPEEIRELTELVKGSAIVGISGIYISRQKAVQIAESLKSDKRTIITGGYDASLNPVFYTNKASFDYVCIGDGEKAIHYLIRQIQNRQMPKDKILPVMPVKDLDMLPVEDYSGKFQYVLENGKIIRQKRLPEYDNPRGDTSNSLFYVASRGCSFHCSFCQESPYMKKSKVHVRVKSPDKVISDLKTIKTHYPEIKKIYFVDPDFFLKPERWFDAFKVQYSEEIGIPFWVFGNPKTIIESKLEKLIDAGLKEIEIGIQSGSEKTRKEIFNKNITDNEINSVISLISKYPVIPWIDIIWDNPYEEREDLLASINFLRKTAGKLNHPFRIGSFGLRLLPGTALENRANTEGIVEESQEGKLKLNFHERHVSNAWDNIYLNTLIRLMGGYADTERLGQINIRDLDFLTDEKIIDFMGSVPEFSRILDRLVLSQGQIIYSKARENE